jgi:hypothetical protein
MNSISLSLTRKPSLATNPLRLRLRPRRALLPLPAASRGGPV